MKAILRAVICVMFLTWLLPLGLFLSSSQGAKICSGRKPVCVCPHLLAKQLKKLRGEAALKTATPAAADSSAQQPKFILLYAFGMVDPSICEILEIPRSLYTFQYRPDILHVPLPAVSV